MSSPNTQDLREIVLDTETTGLDPFSGHRIVEIGCVELIGHLPTGRVFHKYCDPERDMPAEAERVHGLSIEFLSKHPPIAAILDDFVEFVGESKMIIHNASFDMKFINWELANAGLPELPMDQSLDTVAMARKKFPGSQVSLDALCKRFSIDNSAREKHGALLDSELLAEVYLELIGGRAPELILGANQKTQGSGAVEEAPQQKQKPLRPARPHAPSDGELSAHQAFLDKIKEPLWLSD